MISSEERRSRAEGDRLRPGQSSAGRYPLISIPMQISRTFGRFQAMIYSPAQVLLSRRTAGNAQPMQMGRGLSRSRRRNRWLSWQDVGIMRHSE
jgi:hypothetical protein